MRQLFHFAAVEAGLRRMGIRDCSIAAESTECERVAESNWNSVESRFDVYHAVGLCIML